jgi:hypothetical protein
MKKSPLNHCDSEMMHSGGWGQVRKYNSPGTIGNKEAITHNKKIMNKIGTFNMPHSPLNKGHEVNKDSIASQKAWKDHKAGYLKKEGGQKEYDMEKGEFFYSPKHKKLRLIPTDDGEVQDRSGIEKWQLAPDRKSSALHQDAAEKRRIERAQNESGETQFFTNKKAKPVKISKKPRGTYKDVDGTVKYEDGTDAGYPNRKSDPSPLDCWEGYERVPGTKEFSKGSCRKK